jgi:hypothetical protein
VNIKCFYHISYWGNNNWRLETLEDEGDTMVMEKELVLVLARMNMG